MNLFCLESHPDFLFYLILQTFCQHSKSIALEYENSALTMFSIVLIKSFDKNQDKGFALGFRLRFVCRIPFSHLVEITVKLNKCVLGFRISPL